MTILEKLERITEGKGIIYTRYGNRKVEKIIYSPISNKLSLKLEDTEKLEIHTLNEYCDSYLVKNNTFTTLIERDDSKTYPEIVKEGKWDETISRYSEYGRRGYDSTHEDLESSTLETKGRMEGKCIYCGREPYSIQADVREYNNYDTTGKTCLCLDSELEKERDYILRKAEAEYNVIRWEINKKYPLRKNEKLFLELEIEKLQSELKRMEER